MLVFPFPKGCARIVKEKRKNTLPTLVFLCCLLFLDSSRSYSYLLLTLPGHSTATQPQPLWKQVWLFLWIYVNLKEAVPVLRLSSLLLMVSHLRMVVYYLSFLCACLFTTCSGWVRVDSGGKGQGGAKQGSPLGCSLSPHVFRALLRSPCATVSKKFSKFSMDWTLTI